MEYYVQYRPDDRAAIAAREAIMALNAVGAPASLAHIRAQCVTLYADAYLADGAGVRAGWVWTNGTYLLREHLTGTRRPSEGD